MKQYESARVTVLLPSCLRVVQYDLGQVIEDKLDKAFCNVRRVVHRGRGINLDEPDFQVLVDHKVVAEELKRVLACLHHVLDGFQGADYLPLELGPYDLLENVLAFGPAIGLHEVVAEFIAGPHIAFDLAILELFGLGHDSVVRQVHILIGYLLNVVVDGRESDVALPVDPYGQGVPIGDEHPLANIELLPEDQHRVLDVLLHDPLPRIYLSDVLHHLLVAAETLNAPASGLTPRLKYPRVAVPIYIVLWVLLPQLFQ